MLIQVLCKGLKKVKFSTSINYFYLVFYSWRCKFAGIIQHNLLYLMLSWSTRVDDLLEIILASVIWWLNWSDDQNNERKKVLYWSCNGAFEWDCSSLPHKTPRSLLMQRVRRCHIMMEELFPSFLISHLLASSSHLRFIISSSDNLLSFPSSLLNFLLVDREESKSATSAHKYQKINIL